MTESALPRPIPQPPMRCAAETDSVPGRKCRAVIRASSRVASAASISGGCAGACTRRAPAANAMRAAARTPRTSPSIVSGTKR